MKKVLVMLWVVVLALSVAAPVASAADDMAAKLNAVMSKATDVKFWQVSAEDVQGMIKAKKTDFVVVDVRPNPAEYAEGHIPGSIQITVQDIFKPENLKKLPKNKKVILACVTGQTQNLPVVGLRALGYDAYTMAFGYSAWTKGYRGGGDYAGSHPGRELSGRKIVYLPGGMSMPPGSYLTSMVLFRPGRIGYVECHESADHFTASGGVFMRGLYIFLALMLLHDIFSPHPFAPPVMMFDDAISVLALDECRQTAAEFFEDEETPSLPNRRGSLIPSLSVDLNIAEHPFFHQVLLISKDERPPKS